MRSTIIVLAAFALAPAAHADGEDAEATTSCAVPAAGVIDETMRHDVVWTRKAGFDGYHYRGTPEAKTEVAISLRHLVWAETWNCFQWDVELLLPEGASIDGGGSAKSTGNGRDAAVEFKVVLDNHACPDGEAGCASRTVGTYELHEYQGSLRVTLRPNATDAAHGQPAEGGGRGLHWHYPVSLVADR